MKLLISQKCRLACQARKTRVCALDLALPKVSYLGIWSNASKQSSLHDHLLQLHPRLRIPMRNRIRSRIRSQIPTPSGFPILLRLRLPNVVLQLQLRLLVELRHADLQSRLEKYMPKDVTIPK